MRACLLLLGLSLQAAGSSGTALGPAVLERAGVGAGDGAGAGVRNRVLERRSITNTAHWLISETEQAHPAEADAPAPRMAVHHSQSSPWYRNAIHRLQMSRYRSSLV